ncbi:hypothetical protein R5R35_013811 [Gryllus longicercus]|uniref:O-acyltransferase WSD1 C-terminal domain-containing protein n=1 Tax=Gryllus longicercus TaxID=2509291 RepID=A0AAN9V3I5_9ORTH
MENQFSAKNVAHDLMIGPYDYSVILNWTYGSARNISSDVLHESVDGPQATISPLGVVTAALVTFLLSSRGAFKIKHVFDYEIILLGAVLMATVIVTLPLFAILALYRKIVFCLLKMRSHSFISLMEGPDAIWNLEDPSQPIITVLAEIEAEGAECLLKALREAILKAALVNPKLIWKRRYSCMGYSYWQTCSDLSFLKEHVHWMPLTKQNLEDQVSLTELQAFVSNISHQGFPEDNTCWEILVSRHRLIMSNEEPSSVFPVLFRIHHSLGDGVSLLELLMNSLSVVKNKQTQNNSCKANFEKIEYIDVFENSRYQHSLIGIVNTEKRTNMGNINEENKDCVLKQQMREVSSRKKSLEVEFKRGITEIFISEGQIKFAYNQVLSDYKKKATLFSSLIEKVNYLPSFAKNLQRARMLIYSLQTIKKSCETSILNAHKISGKKLIAWYTDSSDGSTFYQVKGIKSKVKGVRFTDVVLTAISRAIGKYLKNKNAFLPNCTSVVVPIYMRPYFNYHAYKMKSNKSVKNMKNECRKTLDFEKENIVDDYHICGNNKLKNSFSLGILNLPIITGFKANCTSHLKNVTQNVNFMHQSGQFEINSFILKWIANLLPAPLLNKFLQLIGPNTMVVSNLVGPTEILFLAGYRLKNIYFWVPQRNNTAISVSMLSYCNRLQLGIMIDKTVMNTSEEVQCLLHEVITEVANLAEQNAH